MCFNKKVLAGLAAAGVGVLLLRPSALGSALPLLLALACPLSMVFMMGAMGGKRDRCATDDQRADQRPVVATAEPVPPADEAELTRLRAELDQLRAEKAAAERDATGDDRSTIGRG